MIEHLLRAIHITVTLLFVFSFNLTRKMELKPLILSATLIVLNGFHIFKIYKVNKNAALFTLIYIISIIGLYLFVDMSPNFTMYIQG